MRAILITLLLAGCGSGQGERDTSTEPDAAEDTAPDTVADAAEDPITEVRDAADVTAEDGVIPLPGCGTGSPEALMACVQRDRYVDDLEFVADVRNPGSGHWQEVQDHCAGELTDLGFTVERQDYGTGVNVIGTLEGETTPATRVIVTAHYDHIPDCEGADDNASGLAGALEAARVLSTASYARTLVVACWDEEERGLIGARAYTTRADGAGEDILVNFNFEMIGYRDDSPGAQTMPTGLDLVFPEQAAWLEARENRGDFVAIVNDDLAHTPAMDMAYYSDMVGLPSVMLELTALQKNSMLFSDLRRSDHAAFWAVDYPAMMITDTSEFRYPYYHCDGGPDTVSNLDHDFSVQVIRATVGAAAASLGLI